MTGNYGKLLNMPNTLKHGTPVQKLEMREAEQQEQELRKQQELEYRQELKLQQERAQSQKQSRGQSIGGW